MAFGCSSGYDTNGEKVSTFSFPLGQSNLIEKQIKFVNRNNWFPTKNSVLSIKHFEDKYILKGKRNKLNWNLQPIMHSHNQLYTYTYGNIVNTIMTNETQFFRKNILLTLYSKWYERATKGLCARGELGTEQRLQYIDPQLSSGYSSTSFSSCRAAQPGALGAQLSARSGSHGFELQQLTPK